MAAMGDVRLCWWTLTAALAILVASSGAAGVEGHGCGQSVHHFNSDEVPFGPLTLVRGLQLRGGSVYALQPPRHIQVVLDGPGEPFKMFLGSFLLEHNPQENMFERPLVDQSVAMQADGEETDPFERAMHLFSSVHLQTRILDIDRIHSELRTAALQRLHRELQWRESQEKAEVVAREASAARLEDDTVTSQRSGFWDNIRNGITSKLRAFQEEPEMAAVQRQQGSQEADELFGLFHRAHAAASSSFFGCLAVGVAVALLCSLVFSCLTALCCQCPSEEEEATLMVVSSPEMISTPLLTTVEHEDSQTAEEGIIQNPLATPAYQPPLVHPSSDK